MTQGFAFPLGSGPPKSVAEALHGKTILLTGVTGLVGQLVLFTLLREYPCIGRVACLVRGDAHDSLSPTERLSQKVLGSAIFTELRAELGALDFDMNRLVEALPGEFGPPRFGWDETRWRDVAQRVDLIINCAGLVEFNGPLDAELSANVDGPLELAALAEFAVSLGRRPPAICHMSTCFVSGTRDGRAPERAPHFGTLGWERVLADLREAVRRVAADGRSERVQESIRRDLVLRTQGEPTARQIARQTRRWVSEQLVVEGRAQARRLRWPNVYTLTKALGELSLLSGRHAVSTVVVRPSIVGAAIRRPRGWLDGADSITPMAALIFKGHRVFPIRRRQALDIIPVDMVANATIAITAMASAGEASGIYQLCSGPNNACPAERLLRLTHDGLTAVRPKRRWQGSGRPLAVPEWLYRIVCSGRWGELRERLRARRASGGSRPSMSNARVARSIIDAYAPFLYRHRPTFESRRTMALYSKLSEHDRVRLPFHPQTIEWGAYWAESQIRALINYGFPRSGIRPNSP